MKTPPTLSVFGAAMKWIGLSAIAMGALGTLFALLTAVRVQTGWGLTTFQRCCETDEMNTAALALLLGSMFFVVAGSGLVLIARPLLPVRAPGSGLRWPRWLARSLFVYSACSVAIGLIILVEAQGVTGAAIGMFVYCVLVGVGSLLASWGLTRFAEVG